MVHTYLSPTPTGVDKSYMGSGPDSHFSVESLATRDYLFIAQVVISKLYDNWLIEHVMGDTVCGVEYSLACKA